MEEQGLTLNELYIIIRKNFLIILGTVVLGLIIGWTYAFVLATPKYQSNAKIMVQVDPSSVEGTYTTGLSAAKQLIDTVTDYIKTDLVLNDAANELDIAYTSGQLRDSLTVTSSSSNYFISLSFMDEEPAVAKAALQQIIESTIYMSNRENPELEGDFILHDTISRIDDATNAGYASPNKLLVLIISVLLGGVLGVLIVFLKEALDNTMRSKEEIEKLFGLQVIGQIPYYELNKGAGRYEI